MFEGSFRKCIMNIGECAHHAKGLEKTLCWGREEAVSKIRELSWMQG